MYDLDWGKWSHKDCITCEVRKILLRKRQDKNRYWEHGEHMREVNREYFQNNRERCDDLRRKWARENKDKIHLKTKRYEQLYRVRAEKAVRSKTRNYFDKEGICYTCGNTEKPTQFHHINQEDPYLVQELCVPCHRDIHSAGQEGD